MHMWRSILEKLSPTISQRHFLTWFSNTAFLSYESGKLVIGVPSEIAKHWLMSKYHVKIFQAAQMADEQVKEVCYEVRTSLQDTPHEGKVDIMAFIVKKPAVRKVPNKHEVIIGGALRAYPLNPRYKLDNFIVGTDNRLPHAACMSVARNPNMQYNPLFIYGSVGLGKTHLLQGTGNAFSDHFPDRTVAYITAEYFVSEVVEAIRTRKMHAVKEKYRSVDCLLVDDVQFFVKKESSQQEFFHTIDALFQANKQVVLTSDRPPHELSDIDKRLTSRFGMGITVEVSPPDFETRLAILQAQCQEKRTIIDREVMEFLAAHIKDNVRSLEGALSTLVMMSDEMQTMPTVQMVKEILPRFLTLDALPKEEVPVHDQPYRPLTHEEIIRAVSQYFHIAPELMKEDDRHKEVTHSRQAAMYFMRTELNYSFDRIGKIFGGRNHSTVLHAYEKMSNLSRTDEKTVRDLTAIKKGLGL